MPRHHSTCTVPSALKSSIALIYTMINENLMFHLMSLCNKTFGLLSHKQKDKKLCEWTLYIEHE